jgi:hypothetical protein
MSDPVLPSPLGRGIPFNSTLGMFHQNWAAIDLYTDFAIYKFLKITPQQAHLIVSGMMFGRKARLLADLVHHTDLDNKSKIMGPFNIIRAAKREIITHSYFKSDPINITFMERSVSGEFKAVEHNYTFEEFRLHVVSIADAVGEFVAALGPTQEEINDFVQAALSLNRKSAKSPDRPTSSK